MGGRDLLTRKFLYTCSQLFEICLRRWHEALGMLGRSISPSGNEQRPRVALAQLPHAAGEECGCNGRHLCRYAGQVEAEGKRSYVTVADGQPRAS